MKKKNTLESDKPNFVVFLFKKQEKISKINKKNKNSCWLNDVLSLFYLLTKKKFKNNVRPRDNMLLIEMFDELPQGG